MNARWRPPSLAWLVASWLAVAGEASAHPTPGSVAHVDFTVDGARIEQDVPIEELQRAIHRELIAEGEDPAAAIRRSEPALRAYAAEHLRAASIEGDRPWAVEVLDVVGHASDDGPRARFRFALRAPGADAGGVRLRDDLVAHEVVSHYTSVYQRSDWASGPASHEPRLIGTIHAGHFEVLLTRGGSLWRGLRGVVSLGAEHIATGTDHLLFLLALVLVAPVRAEGGRWRARPDSRATLGGILRVVTAFTLGHSATLAVGALGGAVLPSSLVEAAIALSVLVAALHAARPIFPRREALVAGAFGLVHGLAFAGTLAGRDLGRAQAAWTLVGFNTGIELAQLGLLSLVLPWLMLLARTRFYAPFRAASAALTGLLALGWLLERTTSLTSPLARPLAWMEAHPLPLLLSLAAFALLARATDARADKRDDGIGAEGAGLRAR